MSTGDPPIMYINSGNTGGWDYYYKPAEEYYNQKIEIKPFDWGSNNNYFTTYNSQDEEIKQLLDEIESYINGRMDFLSYERRVKGKIERIRKLLGTQWIASPELNIGDLSVETKDPYDIPKEENHLPDDLFEI